MPRAAEATGGSRELAIAERSITMRATTETSMLPTLVMGLIVIVCVYEYFRGRLMHVCKRILSAAGRESRSTETQTERVVIPPFWEMSAVELKALARDSKLDSGRLRADLAKDLVDLVANDAVYYVTRAPGTATAPGTASRAPGTAP